MKLQLRYILCLLCLCGLQGCESAMPEFNDPECGVRFPDATSPVVKTFIYDKPGTTEAKVYITVQSVGMVKDYDRPVRMEQIESKDTLNARLGVHYLSIPDSVCYIPANESVARIPVMILNDASLDEEQVVLRLKLVDNEYFKVNIGSQSKQDVVISNLLSQPNDWFDFRWGTYGRVKHQFLIDISGERWDDEFLAKVNQNYSLILFWQAKARQELILENQRRAEDGKGPLREKPLPGEEEGILVEF